MKYFSMFSGIRGFKYGINAASSQRIQQGRDNEDMHNTGGASLASKSLCDNNEGGPDGIRQDQIESEDSALREGGASQLSGCPLCIGHSEIDKYAIQISEKHYPEDKNYGDCARIKWNNVPDFELLCGGFPCQSFSIAGKRGGFSDTRGTLFFEIARCLGEKQPRLFLLENVKGLLSHDKGSTFLTILTTLDELGYDLQWQVLNSKNFGVPQNRERVFIIGHLRGTRRPEVFPLGESGSRDIKSQAKTQGKGKRVRRNIASTLAQRDYKGGNNLVAMTETRTEEAKKIRRETKDGDFSPRRGKILVPRNDDMSNCVTGGQSKESFLTDGCKIRRLTPTECERLQGFPDGWTEWGRYKDEYGVYQQCKISDTQRYKCLGNAVTTTVVQAIFEKLIKPVKQDSIFDD